MNMTMPPELKDKLEVLRDKTNAESLSEVIRRSLAIYEVICAEQDKKSTVIFRSKDGTEKELMII